MKETNDIIKAKKRRFSRTGNQKDLRAKLYTEMMKIDLDKDAAGKERMELIGKKRAGFWQSAIIRLVLLVAIIYPLKVLVMVHE